jgi:hypothetical protein
MFGLPAAFFGAAIAGAIIGLCGSLGALLLRRTAWSIAQALGWVALAGAGYLVLISGGMVLRGLGGGGEGSMNALMVLIFGIGFGTAFIALSTIIGTIQAVRLAKPVPATILTALLDPFLAAIAVFTFLSLVTQPMERKSADDFWQQERSRRERVDRLKKEIPEQYVNLQPSQLEFDRMARANAEKVGIRQPPMVPPEVEAKLKEYWALRAQANVPADLSAYDSAREMNKGFCLGLGASWLIGAIGVPFLLRPKPKA